MDEKEFSLERSKLRFEALKERAERKYRLWFTGIIGSVIAVLGIGVPAVIQSLQIVLENKRKETELAVEAKRQAVESLGKYLDQGINQNINSRIRFAHYFASLIDVPQTKQIWEGYLNDLKRTRNELQAREAEIDDTLNQAYASKTMPRIEVVKLELERLNIEAFLGPISPVNYTAVDKSLASAGASIPSAIAPSIAGPSAPSSTICRPEDFNNFKGAASKLTSADIADAARKLDTDPGVIKALVAVNSGRSGGFLNDGRPRILFERHIFSRITKGRFDESNPDVSSKSAGGYGPAGSAQYDRLARAMALDCDAALSATSWGLMETMGSEYRAAGYDTVAAFVGAHVESEGNQLAAAANVMSSLPDLKVALKNHDWQMAGKRLFGRSDIYATKLAEAYDRFAQ